MGDPIHIEGSAGPGNTNAVVDVWPEKIWPRLQAGPLAAVREELSGWLVAQGYAPSTQYNLARAAVRLGTWMLAKNLRLEDLDQARVLFMVRDDNERNPKHSSANENLSAVLRFLKETGRLRPVRVIHAQPRPAEACLANWLRFLKVEQGQGASWIDKARRVGEPFLELIEEPSGELHWERVNVAMANEFLHRTVSGYSPSTAQCTAALLRCLLTWAAANGRVTDGIAFGVLSPRRIHSGLPKGLSASEVAALKGAVDLASPTGRRDMAVIVMLARLGVRVGEVAGLTLDDVNWRDPSLRVVGKGGRVLILPMPVDVGEALVDYLRVRRAQPGERGVFIRSMPPFRALNRVGVTEIMFKHARMAGLEGVNAHRLRHTAATQILAGGGNLRQVQELLGHASLASSMTYARVDMIPLRPLAPSWGKLP
ncbi:tyrosine-type recombinase/integrase [uncultured Arthrobacter sp.]|uniref:tyrosine-type recombinase/integrase n=1 Tax=uncultured Arthrobacter sp. TaxID=114050 RepID=UPI0028D26267|nr:tyrosine-type recombinase/integrase [uncultured Arthrobacter sp.]